MFDSCSSDYFSKVLICSSVYSFSGTSPSLLLKLIFFSSSFSSTTGSIIVCPVKPCSFDSKSSDVSCKEVSEQEVLKKIKELNDNNAVSGILVQLPLPSQINKEKIINFGEI